MPNAFLKLASCASENIAKGMFANVPPDAIMGKSGFAKAILPQYLAQTHNKTAGFGQVFVSAMAKIAMSKSDWMNLPKPAEPTAQNPSTSSYETPPPPPPPKTNPLRTSAVTPSADPTTSASRAMGASYMAKKSRDAQSRGFPEATAPHGSPQMQ